VHRGQADPRRHGLQHPAPVVDHLDDDLVGHHQPNDDLRRRRVPNGVRHRLAGDAIGRHLDRGWQLRDLTVDDDRHLRTPRRP
jgi:hypothetical protein